MATMTREQALKIEISALQHAAKFTHNTASIKQAISEKRAQLARVSTGQTPTDERQILKDIKRRCAQLTGAERRELINFLQSK
ncbi:MAG TPA: hypothetical protein VEF04_09235 [Blastocatellia bacterium]|nr:hypothetical protein [Blastocatellia bacterium]